MRGRSTAFRRSSGTLKVNGFDTGRSVTHKFIHNIKLYLVSVHPHI